MEHNQEPELAERNRTITKHTKYLLLSTILLIVILRFAIVLAFAQLGSPTPFSSQNTMISLYPHAFVFLIVPIAYVFSNIAFKISFVLFFIAYVYSFVYVFLEFKGNEWIFYPLTSTPSVIKQLQFIITITYPSYLLVYGYHLWKMAFRNGIVQFNEKDNKHLQKHNAS